LHHHSHSKIHLRKILRKERAAINTTQQKLASIAAMKLFSATRFFSDNSHFACYAATGHEFELTPLIELIWQVKKKCYLPVVSTEKSLNFYLYQEDSQLSLNQYHILEPLPLPANQISVKKLDLVFVPLLGFNRKGNRLGTGGGYYDRAFALSTSKSHDTKPYFIGVGYAQQEIDDLQGDEWDITLDAVLTEKEFHIIHN
jgi:5-formyltetrahydrofolate cyclo-ligase